MRIKLLERFGQFDEEEFVTVSLQTKEELVDNFHVEIRCESRGIQQVEEDDRVEIINEEVKEIEILIRIEFEENTVETVANDELHRVDEKSGVKAAVQREYIVEEIVDDASEEVDDGAGDEVDEGDGEAVDEGADEVVKEADMKLKILMAAPYDNLIFPKQHFSLNLFDSPATQIIGHTILHPLCNAPSPES